jgi:hypothetical protein
VKKTRRFRPKEGKHTSLDNTEKNSLSNFDVVDKMLWVSIRGLQGDVVSPLQRKNAENWKQIFPEKEYRGLSPNFHIHVSVSELYIPTMELQFLLKEICGPFLGI